MGRRLTPMQLGLIAFGLLVLYHVGMLYVPWHFHLK